MATLADLFSIPRELEFEGKKYNVRPPTLLEQGKFQRWLEKRADEAIDRKSWLSDDQRQAEKRLLNQDIAAGLYEWESEVSVNSLQTRAGVTKLIELICNIPPPEAERLVECRMKAIVDLVRAKQAKDPKAMRAALTMLGLPANFLSKKKHSLSGSARERASRRKKSRR